MSKVEKKILVALDFDHTIINENSDTFVYQLAPDKVIPPALKALYRKDGWTHYMCEVFKFLHANSVTPDQILSCVQNTTLTEGMEELFTSLPAQDTDFIIISDSNTVFINHILKTKGLYKFFHSVFTNHAEFEKNGCLSVRMYHKQDKCDLSTINLCKGDILTKFVEERSSNAVEYSRIAYVGDGYNDFCPSLRLLGCDAVFPRLNYNLIKTIPQMEKERDLQLKANVHPWASGREILDTLLPWYKQLKDLAIPSPRLYDPGTISKTSAKI
ncbi:UNVERIFIED_CONTAM: hypothetical protein GTU68_043784 [Idotea baltica]|nr:hypothetical protein [Idotea baltica]